MFVFILSTTFILNISQSKNKLARYNKNFILVFMYSIMKAEFSPQIFEKSSNINFIKMHPVVAELFHSDGRTDRRTDRHDESNSLILL
jgi:hypothetical protein